MFVEEFIDNVLAKRKRNTTIILCPATHFLLRIGPE